MNKQQLIDQIIQDMNDFIEYKKTNAKNLIKQIDFIPKSFTGDAMFNGVYIVVESKDKNVFLDIARNAGKRIEKRTDSHERTGQLVIGDIRSVDVPLPDTCKFEAVTKTYTEMEPVGDCGSWFDKKENNDE